MNLHNLLDPNMDKIIVRCYINNRRPDMTEIHVIYADGTRENIWTYDPSRYDFDRSEIVAKTKLEAVFYCDRKEPRSINL